MWIVGIAVMASTAAAALMSETTRAQMQVRMRDTTSAPTAASIPIRVELLRSEKLGQDNQMNLRVGAGGDAGSGRVLLYVDQVTIRLRDGTPVIVRGNQGSNAIVAPGNPLGASIHWLHDETDFVSLFSLPLSFGQRSAIAKGVTGLELTGRVYVLKPRTLGLLPIEPRRSLARDGTRIQILAVTPARDGGTLSVQSTSAVQTSAPPPFDRLRAFAGRQYAFVNEARGEAVYPYSTSVTSGPNTLVLPSMPLVNETATLQMKATAGTVRDAAWFMGARLALVEWKQVATHDVRIPIVDVPTPPELRPHDSVTQPRHSVPAAPGRSSALKRGLTGKPQELAT